MLGKIALGKYRLLGAIGSGSNAEVYLAEPLKHPNYRVVVKRVHDHVVARPNFRQQFEAEVHSMANFHHPYAVRLLEAALDDPIGPCLVMEYVPGVTLEDLLAKQRMLPYERVGRLLGCFCHALQAAHDAGIIHRDLKPANLMVLHAGTPDETLKVMDFGFAGFSAKPHIQLAELTGQGPIFALGTPVYVSPEMIRGDRVDSRSDLYSVGIILYEALTGRVPFEYQTEDKLLGAHLKESPPRFSKIKCEFIPPSIEATVLLALSKFPNERQQSARDLVLMFGEALGENYWEQTTPQGWDPKSSAVNRAMQLKRTAAQPANPFHVNHEFEVFMPERLAAAKIRGFVDDFAGEVLASEPGVILMRLGVPKVPKQKKQSSGIFSWFGSAQQPKPIARGQEPVELELQMEKPDPDQTHLRVTAVFRPIKEYPPADALEWHARCDNLNKSLRQYLGV